MMIDGQTDIKVDRGANDSDFKLVRALHAVQGGTIEVNSSGKSNLVTVDGDLYADGKGYTDGSAMSLEIVVNPWTHWEQDTDLRYMQGNKPTVLSADVQLTEVLISIL